MGQSVSSRVTNVVIQMLARQPRGELAAVAAAAVAKERSKHKALAPSAKHTRGLTVTERTIEGARCFVLAAEGAPVANRATLVYLHGGSYTFEINPLHYRMLRKVALRSGAEVIVVIYTLAPEQVASVTVPQMGRLLSSVIDERAASNVVLAGDSAGGGMALAVAQHVRDSGSAQPRSLFLIAPWLDISMTNPEQEALVARDPMLHREGLREFGKMYAGVLELQDPLVAPVEANLEGLPPISVVCGDRDMLAADSRRLVELGREAGLSIDYTEVVGAAHAYPLLPIREAKAAIAAFASALSPRQ